MGAADAEAGSAVSGELWIGEMILEDARLEISVAAGRLWISIHAAYRGDGVRNKVQMYRFQILMDRKKNEMFI